MREEERRLFPLSTIGSVVQLFRLQLSGPEEPDIALLSIVSGCVENSLTSPRTGGVAEVSDRLWRGCGLYCRMSRRMQAPWTREQSTLRSLRCVRTVVNH